MLLGLGLVTAIVAQALFNISVVLSLVPTKGIPLPFISYGGSSLVPTLIAVGILLNISQYANSGSGGDGLGGGPGDAGGGGAPKEPRREVTQPTVSPRLRVPVSPRQG
jgi:cell division protein FtsW